MTYIISILIVSFFMFIMAIGVILGRSPLKGSCGGKGGPECACDDFEQKRCKAREQMLQAQLGKRA